MDTLLSLTGCGLMIICFGYIATFWFRAMFAFDKLIKYEYENLPEQWEKDGQPRGMFWRPESQKISLFNRLLRGNPGLGIFRFLFTAPEWVKASPEPTSYVKRFRKFTLLWNIGVIILFFVVFPSILIVFTPR